MSANFIAFGILSFVLFIYALYAQNQQIKALKKTVRSQRNQIESSSTPTSRETDRIEQYLEEDWADVEKLFRHNSTMK
jgi:hypothetical protein